MNKKELKQIILEEFKLALSEMGPDSELYPDGYDFGSPEEMAADSRPEEDDITPPGIEDMSPDPISGANPSFVGEEELSEMPRKSNIFKVKDGADLKSILQFMQRVNDVLKTYKSPGQKRPKKRFTPEEMKALAKVMVDGGKNVDQTEYPKGFNSQDILDIGVYKNKSQANDFLKALEQKGLITLTSQLKKAMEPTRDPNTPETRGRKKKSAEFDVPDNAMDMDMSDFEDLDLSGFDDLFEVKKYIKQQILKEAKSPLANKMKEVETRSRIAALETKLEAIQEMMDETNERLTRIDEDEEFTEMMDKTKVKEIRKQLKELERAQAKIQKEYEKVSGGRKKKRVVGEEKPFDEKTPEEMSFDDTKDLALSQAGIPEEVELKENNKMRKFIKNNKMRRSLKENMLNPKLKRELEKLFPEEWEGSWDDTKNDFVVPFEDTYMIPMSDVLDSEFWPNNINKVPTNWVLIDQFKLKDGRRPNNTYITKSFARLIPNKGIELKVTTESANDRGLNESTFHIQKLAGVLTEGENPVQKLVKIGYSNLLNLSKALGDMKFGDDAYEEVLNDIKNMPEFSSLSMMNQRRVINKLGATYESMLRNMRESTLLRMQKLAGLITESDIKKKLNLNENFDPEPANQGDWDDANPPEAFGFTAEIYPKDSDNNDGSFNFNAPEIEVFFDAISDFDSNEEAKAHFNKLFDPSQEDMWYEFIEREAAEMGIRDFEYESFQPMIIR